MNAPSPPQYLVVAVTTMRKTSVSQNQGMFLIPSGDFDVSFLRVPGAFFVLVGKNQQQQQGENNAK